jgi:predicted RNA-binding protein with PUA-like domain
MSYFLAKTEPSDYSMDDLATENDTTWDGIKNPQALRAVRAMKTGDRVFIYHSGGQSAIAGLARVTAPAQPDPKDPKLAVVKFQYVGHLDPPTPLSDVKASGLFADWALVKQPRLSTMPVPDAFVEWMRKRYPGVKI